MTLLCALLGNQNLIPTWCSFSLFFLLLILCYSTSPAPVGCFPSSELPTLVLVLTSSFLDQIRVSPVAMVPLQVSFHTVCKLQI